jgi:hypothetical protein
MLKNVRVPIAEHLWKHPIKSDSNLPKGKKPILKKNQSKNTMN